MRFFVPEIGTRIKLLHDWTFPLHFERRNQTLGEYLGVKPPPNPWSIRDTWMDWNQPDLFEIVTLPAGSELRLSRIYVRQGKKDYSSLSFTLGEKKLKKTYFWAKLADVHAMDFDVLA